MTTAVVVVAAGLGRRLGDDGPKALVEVAGRTMLDHALERVVAVGVEEIVVVCSPGHEAVFEPIVAAHDVDRLVPGGATRSASVRVGVAAVSATADVVAIHDAARAFTPPAVMRSVLEAVQDGAIAAAPALKVADTLKLAEGAEVVATVPRQGLRAVQTPQAFRREVLDLALGTDTDATDDLSLVETVRRDGLVAGSIRLVPGSVWGRKVTYPEDLALAELLARGEGP